MLLIGFFLLLSVQRDLAELLAGESMLIRLELTECSARYHKIGYSSEAIAELLGESHKTS